MITRSRHANENLNSHIPGLGRSRLRLLPMGADAAFEAVREPAAPLMTDTLARRVVTIVAGRDPVLGRDPAVRDDKSLGDSRKALEVEPALLSLFCRELNEERKRRKQPVFDERLVEGAKRDILFNYYSSCVQGFQPRVANFIETELITEKGFRNSFAREDAVPGRLTEDELGGLIRLRLLRLEERYGAQRIELTHDVLTGVVREHRDRRRAEEEKAALAAGADRERQRLKQAAAQREAELDRQRRDEREQRLESEARAGRRFRLLSLMLAVMCVLALALALGAFQNWQAAKAAARISEHASREAATARNEAEQNRQLALHRLQVILEGFKLRQAVLIGDRALIGQFLQQGRSHVQLTVTAEDLGYLSDTGREVFRFSLHPDPATFEAYRSDVAAITYRANAPQFMNPLYATGPDRDFTASYDGVSCVVITGLIEFFDADRMPELTEFDMCTVLGW